MDNVALIRFAKMLSVREIMTPTKELGRASTLENAQSLFPQYDVVPFPKRGKIEGYFLKDSVEKHPIATNLVLSNSTSLLDLLHLLTVNRFYFIIAGNAMVGYVHYADLNKDVTRVPLFALIQFIEGTISKRIEGRITEDDLGQALSNGDLEGLKKKREKRQRKNVDLGWMSVLGFRQILKMANHYGLIRLDDSALALLKFTRDRVAHASQDLVTQYSDVAKLARAAEVLKSLVGHLAHTRVASI